MFRCSLRCPWSCFYVTSLLKGEDKASVPDNDFSSIQTLQNALREMQTHVLNEQMHAMEMCFLHVGGSVCVEKVRLHNESLHGALSNEPV